MSKTHFFNVDVAADFSVNQSIVLSSLMWWYQKVESHKENLIKGKYWVRMSAASIKKLKPYFTVRQVRISLEKLVDNGLLLEDSFNDQKNDHTKWYSPTELAKKYYGLTPQKEGYKNVTQEGYKNVTQGYKNVTSIYKEVDIDSRYILLLRQITENLSLLEIIAMQNKISIQLVKDVAETYVKTKVAAKTVFNNRTHFLNSFAKWVLSNNYKNLDEQLDWFINQFNAVSRKNYVKTDTISERFARQFSFGFTGDQMVKAVQNMYSSSIKNEYHLKTNFKFATPEYLLKDDNLNKYLNVKL